jgi:outer membrane protein OmpA-like peptidoglycan-associated protein
MNFRCLGGRFVCLAALTFAASAQSQDRFDIEAMDPVTASAGSLLSVYGARTLEKGSYALALQGSYGRKPLSIETAAGDSLGDLVGSVGTLQLLGAYGLHERLDLGVGVPLHRISAGGEFEVAPPASVQQASMQNTKVALGDIRVVPRVSLYKHRGPAGFDVALLASLWLPTGGNEYYAGESLRVEPRVALDYSTRKWLVAFNAGYLVRPSATVLGSELNDQLRLGLGTSVELARGFSVLAEVDARLNVLANDFGNDDVASEALAGLRYRAGPMVAQLAAGPGLVRGMSAPLYRMLASIELSGAVKQPTEQADYDYPVGGPDRCLQQQMDNEPPRDDQGCPDDDYDGIVDTLDQCQLIPEDNDGWQDTDGCPDLDNDGDGIVDASDRCPSEAEDKDDWQDEDGCPDPDNDRDTLADADDHCPLVPGPVENHGCPRAAPVTPAAAVISNEWIELREMVLFGNNNAQIEAASFGLLDFVAQLLAEHVEITHVVVEGHTNSIGKTAKNQTLSEARAQSVMAALVSRGIATSRLSSAGYGESRPLVPNDNPDSVARNRRVELRIAQRSTP